MAASGPDGYQTLPSRGTHATAPPAFTDCCHLDIKPLRVGFSPRAHQLLIQPESVVQHLLVRDPAESDLGLRGDGETQCVHQLGRKPSDFWLEPYFCTPSPPSGATKERLGAPVLRGHGAEAAGEDERRRAAREDEEAPEGSRPPTQTHPEPRRPPRLSVTARPVLPAPALSRFGISMFRTLSRMT